MNLLHRFWLLLVRIHNLVRDGLAAALSCVLGAPGVVLDLEDELEQVESWDGLSIKSESEVWGQERAARPTVAAGGLVLSVHLSLEYLEDEVLTSSPSSCSSFIFSGRHSILAEYMQ